MVVFVKKIREYCRVRCGATRRIVDTAEKATKRQLNSLVASP